MGAIHADGADCEYDTIQVGEKKTMARAVDDTTDAVALMELHVGTRFAQDQYVGCRAGNFL